MFCSHICWEPCLFGWRDACAPCCKNIRHHWQHKRAASSRGPNSFTREGWGFLRWDLSRWTAKTRRFAPSLSSPLVLNVFPCSCAREAASARKPQSPCPPASLIDHEGTSVSMIWSGSCLVEPDVLWTCRRGERSLASTSPGWVLVGWVRSGDSVLLCVSSCVSSCVSLISLLASRGGEVLVGPSLFRAPKPFDLRVFPLGRPIGMDGEIHIFISIMDRQLCSTDVPTGGDALKTHSGPAPFPRPFCLFWISIDCQDTAWRKFSTSSRCQCLGTERMHQSLVPSLGKSDCVPLMRPKSACPPCLMARGSPLDLDRPWTNLK